MSPKFNELKLSYEQGFIRKDQLARYVVIGQKKPSLGITASEYEQITNEAYTA